MCHPTVFVVDDDPGARNSLVWLLESVRLVVQTFDSGEQFLKEVDEKQSGCVLLDLRMPGMSGQAVLAELATREISPPVVLVTAYGNVSTTARAMRTGAFNVLEKPYDDQVLLDTLHEAFQVDQRNRAEHAQRVVVRARLALLTPRESEVLNLIMAGMTNKAIASQLQVSIKNVEFHRANIYQKMQAESLAELVRMVLSLGEPNAT